MTPKELREELREKFKMLCFKDISPAKKAGVMIFCNDIKIDEESSFFIHILIDSKQLEYGHYDFCCNCFLNMPSTSFKVGDSVVLLVDRIDEIEDSLKKFYKIVMERLQKPIFRMAELLMTGN